MTRKLCPDLFSAWLSNQGDRPGLDRPGGSQATADLDAWLRSDPPIAVVSGGPRWARLAALRRWAWSLPDHDVLLLPVGSAWATLLERQHLPILHRFLSDVSGRPAARVLHPSALRDAVAELLEYPDPEAPDRTLLILDGLDSAVDGDFASLLAAWEAGARERPDEVPLRLLLAGNDSPLSRLQLSYEPVRVALDLPALSGTEAPAPDGLPAGIERLAVVHGPIDAAEASSRLGAFDLDIADPRLVRDGDRLGFVREDAAVSGEGLERARGRLLASLLDSWRACQSTSAPATAYLRDCLRSHAVESYSITSPEEGAELVQVARSLVSPSWAAVWGSAAEPCAGFLADVHALRHTVLRALPPAEELRAALVEAAVLDAAAPERGETPADAIARSRALSALAALASESAREDLLLAAEESLGEAADLDACADLARASLGARRERWAESALSVFESGRAPDTAGGAAAVALEMASLAAEPERAVRIFRGLDAEGRTEAVWSAPLSPDVARALQEVVSREDTPPLDLRARLAAQLPEPEAAAALPAIVAGWLQAAGGASSLEWERAGKVLLPLVPGVALDDAVRAVGAAVPVVQLALAAPLAGRLALAGRLSEADDLAGSLSEPHRDEASRAAAAAAPPAERARRAERALTDALDLPLNLAAARAAAWIPLAAPHASAPAYEELLRRYLQASPSHTELGFDLVRPPAGAPASLVRDLFSRLLDHLVHGNLPFRTAHLFCSTEGDLRLLGPLLAHLGGDAAILEAGRAITGVAGDVWPRA